MEPHGRSPYVRSNNPGFTTACTHNRGDPSGQPRAISIGTTRAYGCHSQSFNYQLFCTIRLLIRAHAGLSRGIPQLGNSQPGIKLGFFWKGREGMDGDGRIGSFLLRILVFLFSIRNLFWRLGVGYASYGQLPRFDSQQYEKKRRSKWHLARVNVR